MSVSNDLQTELQSRVNKYGEEVRDRFVRTCLKAVDPCLISFSHYFADLSGEKFNKQKYADGTINPLWPADADGKQLDIPRDEAERKEFFTNLRVTTMDTWLNRIKDGEFDGESKPDLPKEEPVQGGVEIAKEKPPVSKSEEVDCMETCNGEPCPNGKECEPHEEDEPSLMGISGRPVLEQMETLVQYNKVKGTPPVVPMMNAITQSIAFIQELTKSSGRAQHNDNRLQNAIEDIARGVVGPASDSDLQDRIDRIEAKLDEVIETQRKHATALKTIAEKLKDSLSKVPGIIKDEIMKRFS